MKALIALAVFLPSLAFADVSVPRAKQYAWTQYDVALQGGASVAHAQNLALPAGAIITNVWVYINTQFAASGTESLGISCAGSQDIMAYSSVKNLPVDRMLAGRLNADGGTGAAAPIPASPTALNLSQGYNSVPSGCNVTVDVRNGGAAYTPYTAGKMTALIEYFKL